MKRPMIPFPSFQRTCHSKRWHPSVWDYGYEKVIGRDSHVMFPCNLFASRRLRTQWRSFYCPFGFIDYEGNKKINNLSVHLVLKKIKIYKIPFSFFIVSSYFSVRKWLRKIFPSSLKINFFLIFSYKQK